MPLFSVIIPAFNREQTIADTIHSILAQSFREFEVIVVNDGSTDRTVDVLAQFAGKIKVIDQENAGPCHARNNGAQHARGEYLAFLDSDDIWFPWALRAYAQAITQGGSPAFLLGERKDFVAQAELDEVTPAPLKCEVFKDYLSASKTAFFPSASAIVVRRSAFLEAGGFVDQRVNAEDCDLCLRLGEASDFVHVKSPVTFGYRRHEGSLVQNFARAFAGHRMLISGEGERRYPGGARRKRERREILTRHLRPAALEHLRRGETAAAWEIYRATFPWHVELARFRFLFGFPLLALKHMALSRTRENETSPLVKNQKAT